MLKAIAFENDKILEITDKIDIVKKIKDNCKIWIDFINPTEDELNILKDDFKFHPLAIDACVHKAMRSRVHNYEDYYFMVLNAYNKNMKKSLDYTEVYIFIGENYLVTLHYNDLKVINELYLVNKNSKGLIERGVDFLMYELFDGIVDDYFPLTDKIGDEIDHIEDIILRRPGKHIQYEILSLKRRMLKLRRVLSPQREAVNILLRHDFILIRDENRLYFMDVYDHLLRLLDLIENYQDLLSGTMDLYMTQISNGMNEVMKVLTIITTVMMPLTVITGIYGMNFKFMPELSSRYGYFVLLGFMGIVVIAEIMFFKRKKWL